MQHQQQISPIKLPSLTLSSLFSLINEYMAALYSNPILTSIYKEEGEKEEEEVALPLTKSTVKNESPTHAYNVYHYHKYDASGRPVVSVCLIESESVIGCFHQYFRGVALCSPLDFGCLTCKEGKRIARKRALTAYRNFTTYSKSGNLPRSPVFSKPESIEMLNNAMYNSKRECIAPLAVQRGSYVKWTMSPCVVTTYEKDLITQIKYKRNKSKGGQANDIL